MKEFGGKVLFLDRSDINTDEIIPAKYLNESTKEALRPFLLEDLKIPGFEGAKSVSGCSAVLTRSNFGCGSSREHAPWALEMNGINIVIAESFARIFRQNMYNCGMLAVELPRETLDKIFNKFASSGAKLSVDLEGGTLVFSNSTESEKAAFKLSPFEKQLIEAEGWVNYAEKNY